jgi:hypothetical protein
VKLTTHLHLVPRSKNEWSYTSTPQYVLMAWCSVEAQGQLHLYLYKVIEFNLELHINTTKTVLILNSFEGYIFKNYIASPDSSTCRWMYRVSELTVLFIHVSRNKWRGSELKGN